MPDSRTKVAAVIGIGPESHRRVGVTKVTVAHVVSAPRVELSVTRSGVSDPWPAAPGHDGKTRMGTS